MRSYYSTMLIIETSKNAVIVVIITILYMKAMRKLLRKMDLELKYGTEMCKLFPESDTNKSMLDSA